MTTTRRHILTAALCTGLLPLAAVAQTDALGRKPVAVVVPFAAGGSADVIARFLAKPMAERNGWTFTIDNRAGAGGTVGAAFVARAPADGYTLLLATDGMYSINPQLYGKSAQETQAQLQPVMHIAESPLLIVVPASSPIKTFRDFIAAAKTRPLSYGTPGVGSAHQLLGELLAQRIGAPLNHVPYRGAAAALGDLGGGQLDSLITLLATVQPLLDSGRARVIAVSSHQPFPTLRDVPTLAQTFDGLEMQVGYGLMVPAGTPAPLVAQWNKAAREALQDPTVVTKMGELGLQATGGTPEAFRARITKERAAREAIITAAHIKLN